MGKFKDAQKLYNQLPEDHELKKKFGSSLDRKEWKSSGIDKNLNVISNALMKVEFDKQMGEVEDREGLWEKYKTQAENLLKDTPSYEIPSAINDLMQRAPEMIKNIKNEYVQSGNKLEALTTDKMSSIMSGLKEGLGKQSQLVDQRAEELGVKGEALSDVYRTGAEELGRIVGEGIPKMESLAEEGYAAAKEGFGAAEEGFKAAEEGIGKYEDIYGRLASRGTMPGEDILMGNLGSQRESAIQRIKEYGGGSPEGLTAVADVYKGEQESLRDLALQRAGYLTGAKQDYAQALLTGAGARENLGLQRSGLQKQQSAQQLADMYGYTTGLGAETAMQQTDLMGQAAQTDLDITRENIDKILEQERYGTSTMYGAGMGELETEANALKQASMLRSMGYEQEADRLTQAAQLGAGYQERKFQINEMMPWQTKLQYYTGAISQYDPFADKMGVLSDEAGLTLANINALAQERASKRDMWGNIIGSAIGAGSMLAGNIIGSSESGTSGIAAKALTGL